MPDWNDSDVLKWKEEARDQQHEYCELLGNREWDVIEKKEWTILRQKIGFGMYGPPSETPEEHNKYTGYTEEQLNQITKITDKVNERYHFDSQDVHFACVFVIGKIFTDRFTTSVFRFSSARDTSQSIFIDVDCRAYSKWTDYLYNNKLPRCMCCFPKDGIYSKDEDDAVAVQYDTSPACSVWSRIAGIMDVASTVVTVGATAVGVAALCTVPVAGPILAFSAGAGATTAVYGVSRSTYTLYDRGTHDQTIGLGDAEARSCWIAIVGSSLGFAQGRMIASMASSARAGQIMSRAARITFLVVQGGSLTVNGIGIAHGLAVLIDKAERKEVTPLDVFQFSASVLFFTNAVVNCKTAGTIIKEVQRDTINQHREGLSPEAGKLFDKQTQKLRGKREMHGDARVIRALNRVENKHDLYELMVDKNVDSSKVKLRPCGLRGQLKVNNELKVAPNKFLEMSAESRQAIFTATSDLHNHKIDQAKFNADMKNICTEHRIVFENMRKETIQKLCNSFGTKSPNDISIGNQKIFAKLTGHEIDRLSTVLENTCNSDKEIIKMATEFAASRNCQTAGDFLVYTEFLVADLSDHVKSLEAQYQTLLTEERKLNPNLKQSTFDAKYDIQGKRSQHFRKVALNDYRSSDSQEGYAQLSTRFDSYKDIISPLNKAAKPGFFSDNAATYHYVKHKEFGNRVLTPDDYFRIAQDLVGNPNRKPEGSMLSQDGNCVLITYKDPQNGVFAVKVDKITENGVVSAIATIMYDRRVLDS